MQDYKQVPVKTADPRAGLEQVVAAEWEAVLGVAPAPDSDFVVLGGDSLKAAQMLARLNKRFNVFISLQMFFRQRTVPALAALVDELTVAAASETSRPTRSPASPLRLSVMQQNRLLRVTRSLRANGNAPRSALTFAIEICAPVSDDEIVHALVAVTQRHDSMRTGFRIDAGTDRVTPFIAERGVPKVQRQQFDSLSPDARARTLQDIMQTLGDDPVPLAEPPLVTAVLCRFGPGTERVLVIAMDHLVCDTRATDVIVADLAAALRRDAVAGQPRQFADWIDWQHEFLDGTDGSEVMDYWRGVLAGTTPYPELPLPAPTTTVTSRYATAVAALDRSQLASMRASAATVGATPFAATLAALAVAWYRCTGQVEALVHCPCDNRDRVEADGVVGWIAHSLVIRVRSEPRVSWQAFLSSVVQTAQDAFAHQDLPLALLVRHLQPDKHGTPNRQPRLYFAYLPEHRPVEPIAGGTLRRLDIAEVSTYVDAGLSFLAVEADGELTTHIVYDPSTIDGAFVTRLADELQRAQWEIGHRLGEAIAADCPEPTRPAQG